MLSQRSSPTKEEVSFIKKVAYLWGTEQSSLSRNWILLPWALRVGEVVETSWSYRLSLCWQCLYKVYDEHGRVSCDRGLSIGEPGDVSSRCQWCDGPAPSHRGDRSSASGSVSPALTQHSPENGQILHRVDNSGIDNRVKAFIIVFCQSCFSIKEQQFGLKLFLMQNFILFSRSGWHS